MNDWKTCIVELNVPIQFRDQVPQMTSKKLRLQLYSSLFLLLGNKQISTCQIYVSSVHVSFSCLTPFWSNQVDDISNVLYQTAAGKENKFVILGLSGLAEI